jgi:L-fucose isomerase-like protein
MINRISIAVVGIGRIHFDIAKGNELFQAFRGQLYDHGYRILGPQEIVTDDEAALKAVQSLRGEQVDLLVVFQTTFADSRMITILTNELDIPVFIWGPPDERTGERLKLGTFIGVNLACHALTLQGKPYGYAYTWPDNTEAWEKFEKYAKAGSVYRRLKNSQLGVIGERPEGMDTCDLDATLLDQLLGVKVQQVDLNGVFQEILAVPEAKVKTLRHQLDQKIDGLEVLDQEPLNRTLRTYLAVKDMAVRENFAGLGVRCWPEFFTQLGCAACGALSLLSDDCLPATCEADINGSISQLILQWFSGVPAFNTDIVEVDVDRNEIVLWHCGQAPLSMADPNVKPRGTVHSNRRVPLMMDFPIKPGPITLVRLSRVIDTLGIVVGKGEIIKSPQAYTGTAGVFRFERSAQNFLDRFLSLGMEHHISLAYGDYLAEIEILAKMLKIPFIRL